MKVLIEVALVTAVVPAATQPGKYRFDLHANDGSSIVATQDSDTPEAVFESVADGTYVASVGRLGIDGQFIAPPVTQTFTVTSPNIEVDVPGTLTITVAE